MSRALVQGTVVGVNDSSVLYPCCIQCYAKMQQNRSTDTWLCLRCGLSCASSNVMWRYRLSLRVADSSASCNISLFGGTLGQHFGCAANDFHQLISATYSNSQGIDDETILQAVQSALVGNIYIFCLKTNVPQVTTNSSQSLGGGLPIPRTLCLVDLLNCQTSSQQPDWKASDFIAAQMIQTNPSGCTEHRSVLDALKKLTGEVCAESSLGSGRERFSALPARGEDFVKNKRLTGRCNQRRSEKSGRQQTKRPSSILKGGSQLNSTGACSDCSSHPGICSAISSSLASSGESTESEISTLNSQELSMFSCQSSMDREFSSGLDSCLSLHAKQHGRNSKFSFKSNSTQECCVDSEQDVSHVREQFPHGLSEFSAKRGLFSSNDRIFRTHDQHVDSEKMKTGGNLSKKLEVNGDTTLWESRNLSFRTCTALNVPAPFEYEKANQLYANFTPEISLSENVCLENDKSQSCLNLTEVAKTLPFSLNDSSLLLAACNENILQSQSNCEINESKGSTLTRKETFVSDPKSVRENGLNSVSECSDLIQPIKNQLCVEEMPDSENLSLFLDALLENSSWNTENEKSSADQEFKPVSCSQTQRPQMCVSGIESELEQKKASFHPNTSLATIGEEASSGIQVQTGVDRVSEKSALSFKSPQVETTTYQNNKVAEFDQGKDKSNTKRVFSHTLSTDSTLSASVLDEALSPENKSACGLSHLLHVSKVSDKMRPDKSFQCSVPCRQPRHSSLHLSAGNSRIRHWQPEHSTKASSSHRNGQINLLQMPDSEDLDAFLDRLSEEEGETDRPRHGGQAYKLTYKEQNDRLASKELGNKLRDNTQAQRLLDDNEETDRLADQEYVNKLKDERLAQRRKDEGHFDRLADKQKSDVHRDKGQTDKQNEEGETGGTSQESQSIIRGRKERDKVSMKVDDVVETSSSPVVQIAESFLDESAELFPSQSQDSDVIQHSQSRIVDRLKPVSGTGNVVLLSEPDCDKTIKGAFAGVESSSTPHKVPTKSGFRKSLKALAKKIQCSLKNKVESIRNRSFRSKEPHHPLQELQESVYRKSDPTLDQFIPCTATAAEATFESVMDSSKRAQHCDTETEKYSQGILRQRASLAPSTSVPLTVLNKPQEQPESRSLENSLSQDLFSPVQEEQFEKVDDWGMPCPVLVSDTSTPLTSHKNCENTPLYAGQGLSSLWEISASQDLFSPAVDERFEEVHQQNTPRAPLTSEKSTPLCRSHRGKRRGRHQVETCCPQVDALLAQRQSPSPFSGSAVRTVKGADTPCANAEASCMPQKAIALDQSGQFRKVMNKDKCSSAVVDSTVKNFQWQTKRLQSCHTKNLAIENVKSQTTFTTPASSHGGKRVNEVDSPVIVETNTPSTCKKLRLICDGMQTHSAKSGISPNVTYDHSLPLFDDSDILFDDCSENVPISNATPSRKSIPSLTPKTMAATCDQNKWGALSQQKSHCVLESPAKSVIFDLPVPFSQSVNMSPDLFSP